MTYAYTSAYRVRVLAPWGTLIYGWTYINQQIVGDEDRGNTHTPATASKSELFTAAPKQKVVSKTLYMHTHGGLT